MSMARGGVQARILGIVMLMALVVLGLVFGLWIGQGVTGLPIYALIMLAILFLTIRTPEIGVFAFLTIYHVSLIFPETGNLPGFDLAQSYVFGLNVENILLLTVVGTWIVRFIASGRKLQPLGPFGRIIVLYMGILAYGTIRALVSLYTDPYASDPTDYIRSFRNTMIVPTITFILLQSDIDERFGRRLIRFYLIIMFVALALSLSTVVRETDLVSRYVALRSGGMSGILPLFCAIAFAAIVIYRNLMARVMWSAVAFLSVIPVAFMKSRSMYLTIVIELLVIAFLLIRVNRRYSMWAIFLLVAAGTAGALFMPQVVIDRVVFTWDPGAGQTLDTSVSRRFEFWEAAWNMIRDRLWDLPLGAGLGASSTYLSRRYLGASLSLHNAWIEMLVDLGIAGVAINVAMIVWQYRFLRILSRSPHPDYRIFGIALSAFLIALQAGAIAHSSYMGGNIAMMFSVFSALVTLQSRAGGFLADIRLPDGRLARDMFDGGKKKKTSASFASPR